MTAKPKTESLPDKNTPDDKPSPAAQPSATSTLETGSVVKVVNRLDWRITKGQGTPVLEPGVTTAVEADNWLMDQINAGCVEVVK